MTTDFDISEESALDIFQAIALGERIRRLSNEDLSQALISVWAGLPLGSVESEIVDAAIGRLRAWDAPIEEINRKIEAEIDAIELTDEDFAAMDRVFERVMAHVNGEDGNA